MAGPPGNGSRFTTKPRRLVALLCGVAVLLTASCGSNTVVDTENSRDYSRSFTEAGLDRSYAVHLPAGYQVDKSYPVLLVLHGAGGSAQDAERTFGFDAVADARGFITVYGQGTTWGPKKVAVWNAGACCGLAATQKVDDVAYAREVIRQVRADHAVSTVYVTGMSNGGMMSNRLGCEAADLFDGIAPVAGTIQVLTCAPAKQIPVLLIHGTADPFVLYNGGRSAIGVSTIPVTREFVDWGIREHCSGGVVTSPFDPANKIVRLSFRACGERVSLLRIDGGGHAPPPGYAQIVADFFNL